VVLPAVVLALAAVFAEEPARFLVLEDEPEPADAALVLAGDPDYERTKSAVRLWQAGAVRLLILTGGEPGPGDSSSSLRDVALRLGVPAKAIRTEEVSRSTHESMLAVRPILEQDGVRSLAVVTSPYHQRRAVWAAARSLPGVRIVSRPAAPSLWTPRGWWRSAWSRKIVLTEHLKLAYYLGRGWALPRLPFRSPAGR
jgi:uncharacterized SAM-binding protein YcdF (DUF218 family)